MSNLENYKEELNTIHAPEALIQRTLLMVHEEEARMEAEKATDQLTNDFSSMDKAEGGMTADNYKPAKVSFFSKYKTPIFTIVGVAAAAALLIFAANAGIIGGRSSSSTSMDTSSSDTSYSNSEASDDSAASAASDDAADSSSSMATAASDDYAEDADYSADYSEEAASDDSASTSKDKSNRDVEADGSSEMAEDTEASLEEDQAMNIALAGGWEASVSTEVTAELSEVFEKAQEGYTGENYSPVAYLGSQLVSGTNHAFLCKTDSDSYWSIVYVYENLDGVCEITNAYSLDIAASNYENIVLTGKPSGEDMVGGWSMAETTEIDEELGAVIDGATADMSGVSYEPVLVLETQVVAGTNYAVLCKTQSDSEDAEPYWTVLYIYRNLSDEGQVMSSPVIILGE